MANANKVEKILEVIKLNDTLELAEVEVESMPCGVYFLSKAKGVLKFARTEEAYHAYFAKKKEIADAKAAAKAKAAAQNAATDKEPKVDTPVEEPEDPAIQLATKHGLNEVKSLVVPRYFINAMGNQFMWLPKSKVFMSVAPMTDDKAHAHRGKTPVISKRSPRGYEEMAATVGATIPTKSQLTEFVEILVSVAGVENATGLKVVIPDIRLDNQLCTDGKLYTTFFGEYRSLLANFSVFNIECRMVIA